MPRDTGPVTVEGTVDHPDPWVEVLCHFECAFIAAARLEVTGKVDEASIACPDSVSVSLIFSSATHKLTCRIYCQFTSHLLNGNKRTYCVGLSFLCARVVYTSEMA